MIRDGEPTTVPAAEARARRRLLVEEGDTVPADARVDRIDRTADAEAALTGESLPVSKDVEPMRARSASGDRTT